MSKRISLILILTTLALCSFAQSSRATGSKTNKTEHSSATAADDPRLKVINAYANSVLSEWKEYNMSEPVPTSEQALPIPVVTTLVNDKDIPLAKSAPVVIEKTANTISTYSTTTLVNDEDIPLDGSYPKEIENNACYSTTSLVNDEDIPLAKSAPVVIETNANPISSSSTTTLVNDEDIPLDGSDVIVIEKSSGYSTTSLVNDEDIPLDKSAPVVIEKAAQVKVNPVERIKYQAIAILQPDLTLEVNDSLAMNTRRVDLTLYGTPMSVRVPFGLGSTPLLKEVTENGVANALMALSDEANNITLIDCLNLREKHQLCDWAYLQLLNTLATQITHSQNDARLLTAYLYLQSGYKTRFATIGDEFYMLFASSHFIYNKQYYQVDGYNYYCLDRMPSKLYISNSTFPQEKPLSLDITRPQNLAVIESEPITHTSRKYPFFTTTTTVNKNLLDFYSSYPSAAINKDEVTRWVAKANTPMDSTLTEQLYPVMRQLLEGKDRHESLSILLDYVQTGFEYQSDNTVWGGDRAFYPEETMHYPYSDCEDRAILLSRLVSDVLGYDCLLVYYPGHMACAIEMEDNSVEGDYLTVDGKYYIIADPTFINAKLGKSMPTMDLKTAQVIRLDKRG